MDQYIQRVHEVLKVTEERMRRFTFLGFILRFFTSMETMLGVVMDCVVSLHAVSAEFGDLSYEQKRDVIVKWVNKQVNIPGPNEEQEAALL